MIKIYSFLISLFLMGCTRELVIDKSCNSLSDCIDPIVSYINDHIEGVNQLNTDEHALYDPKDSTLVIYIGHSEHDYFKKWVIPLNTIDANLISVNSIEYSGHPVTVTPIDNACVFLHYENNSFKKNTCQWNYYPGATNGSKRKFREKFVLAFKRAVELSQSVP